MYFLGRTVNRLNLIKGAVRPARAQMGGRLGETSSKVVRVHKVPFYWRAV
jgi:hypothetical protein